MCHDFMRLKKAVRSCAAVLVATAIANVAGATTIVYRSEAAFVAELLSPYYVESFSQCKGQSGLAQWYWPVTYPAPGGSFTPSPNSNGYSFIMTSSDEATGTVASGIGITPQTVAGTGGWSTYNASTLSKPDSFCVSYSSTNGQAVTAVGGYFLPDDWFGDLIGVPTTVSIPNDNASVTYTPTALSDSFVGFISTTPIASLTAWGDGVNVCTAMAGNVYVGTARPPLAGDANGDGKVDINDLTIVLTNFGQAGMTPSQGDFNADGKVDINDLTIVLTDFGKTAGVGIRAVPEPSTLWLVACGLIVAAAGVWRSWRCPERAVRHALSTR